MRKEYEMTQAQLDAILNACKPVPYMVFGGMEPGERKRRMGCARQGDGLRPYDGSTQWQG